MTYSGILILNISGDLEKYRFRKFYTKKKMLTGSSKNLQKTRSHFLQARTLSRSHFSATSSQLKYPLLINKLVSFGVYILVT